MNKKGYTLVELLAVILILALLAVIATTSIKKVTANSKKKMLIAKLKIIERAAEMYAESNNYVFNYEGDKKSVRINMAGPADLVDKGFLSNDKGKNGIYDPCTEKKLDTELIIKFIIDDNTRRINVMLYNKKEDTKLFDPEDFCN